MLAWHGRMSRDGVIRHHPDRLTEEDLPEQFGAATRRPEASGGCPNSETADADLNQIVGSCGVRLSLVSMWLLFPFGFFAGSSALTRVLRRAGAPCFPGTPPALLARAGRGQETP